MTSKEIREQRARLAEKARAVITAAQTEKRDLSSEEQATVTRIHSEIDTLRERIDIIEKQESYETELSTFSRRTDPAAGNGTYDPRENLRTWLECGTDRPNAEAIRAAVDNGFDPTSKYLRFQLPASQPRSIHEALEYRAQSTGTPSAGGHTVPDEAMRQLEVALLAFGGMRQAASVIRTNTGAPLPWPTVNDVSNKGVILGENTQVAEEDVVFDQVVFNAYKYSSKMIRIPVELLQDNAVNLAEFVGKALGERIARILNDHFTTGTGTGQPQGIVTASVEGREAASATAITYADLVALEHSIDPAYRQNAKWMLHDSAVQTLKLLTDSTGRPLWQPGLAVREPDFIMGYPYIVNQSMAAPAAGVKSLLFGDLAKYQIRDTRDVTLVRLDERFADFHQVAFLAFSRHDGKLLDAGTSPVKHLVQAS